MVKIRIQYPNGTAAERILQPGTYLIGREAGDIVLGDPNVSSRHAELSVDAGGLSVRDVGSTNGSFDERGSRLTAPIRLQANQWVRMGGSVITVLATPAPVGGTAVMAQVPGGGPAYAAPVQQAPQGYAPSPGYVPPPQAPQGYAPPAPGGYAPPAPGGYAPPAPGGYAPPASPLGGFAPAAAAASNALQRGAGAAAGFLAGAVASFTPPSDGGASAVSSEYSHPDQPVRHSYPLVQQGFGFGAALGLLMKTSPFIMVRLGVLFGLSLLALVYWGVVIGGFVLLSRVPVVAWAWLIVTLVGAGWVWRTVVRYFLYLLKTAHIAVLTEVITQGRVGNGSEGMFAYGKRIVTQRFGEVNALFAVGMLVSGIVGAFNRTLDWVSNLIPIPGLDSVMGFVKAVLRASTTYIDETIFSYNLARGDANVWRSSKDGLVYYAQNSREVLKTGVLVVILERILSFVIFWVIFLPVLALVYVLPQGLGAWLQITAIVTAVLFASSVRQAFLKPLFLTMLLLKFHSTVRGQPIDLVWDQRLEQATSKFRELKDKAAEWAAGHRAPQPMPQAAPAE
jgi:hypothetical protein